MSFRFPAYRTLERNLGLADASAEANEIALRLLERIAVDPNKPALLILKGLAQLTGVGVSNVNAKDLFLNMHHLYLMNVHSMLEVFATELQSQHPEGCDWKRKDKQDDFDFIAEQIHPGTAREAFRNTPEYRITNYYRLVRNKFVHDRSAASERLDDKHTQLIEELKEDWPYGEQPKPRIFGNIAYSDFLHYTKAGKDLALRACRALKPNTKGLVTTLVRMDANNECNVKFDSLRRRNNDRSQQERATISLCKAVFNLDTPTAQEVYLELKNGPLA